MAMIDRWAGNPYAQAAADWPDLAVEQNQTRAESEWAPLPYNTTTGQLAPWTSTNSLTCNSNGTSTFKLDLQDYTPTKSTPPTGSTYVPFSSPQDLQSFTMSGYNKYNKSCGYLGTSTPVMPIVNYSSAGTAAGNDNEVLVPNNGSGKEGTYDNGPGSTMGLVLVRDNNPSQGAISYAIDINGWFDPSS